jgi:hypothetical protein
VFRAIDYDAVKFMPIPFIEDVNLLYIDEFLDPQANDNTDNDHEDEINEEVTGHRPMKISMVNDCTPGLVEALSLDFLFRPADPLTEQETIFTNEGAPAVLGHGLRFVNFPNSYCLTVCGQKEFMSMSESHQSKDRMKL